MKMLLVLHFTLSADDSLGVLRKNWFAYNLKYVTLYLSENSFLGKGGFVSPLNQTYSACLET